MVLSVLGRPHTNHPRRRQKRTTYPHYTYSVCQGPNGQSLHTSLHLSCVSQITTFAAQVHPVKQGSQALHRPAQRFKELCSPASLTRTAVFELSFEEHRLCVLNRSLAYSLMSWVGLPPYIWILENLSLTCSKPHAVKESAGI